MLGSSPLVFNRSAVRQHRHRAWQNFSNHDFLFRRSGDQLAERLEEVRPDFPTALEIGARLPGESATALMRAGKIENFLIMDLTRPPDPSQLYVQGDEEALPFGPNSLDLVISNLSLHTVNDLPGALIQIRRALKPNGMFLASLFGGETLWQLRASLQHTEQRHQGGQSPRIAPFADKQQMGALMQRAGFALPVVDSDILTVTYPNIFKLMVDLRFMGETNSVAARSKTCPGQDFFHEAGMHYAHHYSNSKGQLEASFEMIFLIGWAPHESQQQPLRPGSAELSLAEALNTEEISTGEKAKP